ncbi:PaaI family thioesterase [Elioraea sp.]|uniref:PaaI family thioesterase n=1 Tax=Elioraea sp. TaxID=2185103 RepID=UPI003F721F97
MSASRVAPDPDYESRVHASFARQNFMTLLGASITALGPGTCEITLPFRRDLTQQHGFLHAGVVATLADNACGYAAFTLMPADASVLTVEFKLNLMAPAEGEALIARGRVRRAGRTLTVAEAEVSARRDGAEIPVAVMLATVMALHGSSDAPKETRG